jgi:hypothetical protein
MGRVKAETLKKLHAFIDDLPDDVRSKCALCNETLVHIVTTAEATVQAGTATICKALTDKINETAAPRDRIGSQELRQKALWQSGRKENVHNEQINKIARQSAERQVDLENPSAPIPEPVIDWGTEDPEKIEYIKSISNNNFDVDHDGTIFPIRDPELRKQEHKVTMTIYPHLFDAIDGLTSCPVSPDELYGMIPPYCYRKLAKINEAIETLVAIKNLHEVKQ